MMGRGGGIGGGGAKGGGRRTMRRKLPPWLRPHSSRRWSGSKGRRTWKLSGSGRRSVALAISKIVFPIYRNILAPLPIFLIRKRDRPFPGNFILQFFLMATVGITANQRFYLLGLEHTSPTFASAIQNLVPTITFIMAVLLKQDS